MSDDQAPSLPSPHLNLKWFIHLKQVSFWIVLSEGKGIQKICPIPHAHFASEVSLLAAVLGPPLNIPSADELDLSKPQLYWFGYFDYLLMPFGKRTLGPKTAMPIDLLHFLFRSSCPGHSSRKYVFSNLLMALKKLSIPSLSPNGQHKPKLSNES